MGAGVWVPIPSTDPITALHTLALNHLCPSVLKRPRTQTMLYDPTPYGLSHPTGLYSSISERASIWVGNIAHWTIEDSPFDTSAMFISTPLYLCSLNGLPSERRNSSMLRGGSPDADSPHVKRGDTTDIHFCLLPCHALARMTRRGLCIVSRNICKPIRIAFSRFSICLSPSFRNAAECTST